MDKQSRNDANTPWENNVIHEKKKKKLCEKSLRTEKIPNKSQVCAGDEGGSLLFINPAKGSLASRAQLLRELTPALLQLSRV